MARLIVMGNEKGGSGKSTTAMHLITALVRAGHTVGALDLDLRQKSLFRYLDNRQDYMRRHDLVLPMPRRMVLEASRSTAAPRPRPRKRSASTQRSPSSPAPTTSSSTAPAPTAPTRGSRTPPPTR